MPSKKIAAPSPKSKSPLKLRGGELFAIPLGPLGFCTGIVSRPPNIETGLIHIYLRLETTPRPLTPKQFNLLHTWPAAWIGLVSTKSLDTGRWPMLGSLKNFDRDAFPISPTSHEASLAYTPTADTFSIETTFDEPSLTPIENISATKSEAARFPELSAISAGSTLEKSLVRYIRKMGWTFHDVPIEGFTVGPSDVAHWNAHAAKARAAIKPTDLPWLPAGSKTDRSAKPGDWFGFPIIGGGFGAAILFERPERQHRVFSDTVVLSMRRHWDRWPTLDDLKDLRPEDGALIRQTSFISVRDGRWRALGHHPNFNESDWQPPLRWYVYHQDPPKNLLVLRFDHDDTRYARIDRKIIDLDPDAGLASSSMSNVETIAFDTHLITENRSQKMATGPHYDKGIVTPQRVAAWKIINPVIRDAMKRAVKDKEKT